MIVYFVWVLVLWKISLPSVKRVSHKNALNGLFELGTVCIDCDQCGSKQQLKSSQLDIMLLLHNPHFMNIPNNELTDKRVLKRWKFSICRWWLAYITFIFESSPSSSIRIQKKFLFSPGSTFYLFYFFSEISCIRILFTSLIHWWRFKLHHALLWQAHRLFHQVSHLSQPENQTTKIKWKQNM